MKFLTLISMLLLSLSAFAATPAHMNITESQYEHTETVSRLKAQMKKMGLTLFTEVKHHEGAKKLKKELRPTTLLIFGNPKIGSQFMEKSQLMGFDLPMKALVYVDSDGKTKVAVTKIDQVVKSHKLKDVDPVVKKVTGALGKLVSVVK